MSIKKTAINSGKWITISTVISTILQFSQVAILARLLEPVAFGLVGICTLLYNFFQIFSNLGFSNSIISKQESDKKVLSTIYFTNLILGAVICIVLFFSASLVVKFYHEPRLYKIIRISSLNFIVIYFGQIYSFLLQKEMRFKLVATIDILSSVVGTSLVIFLANRGYEEMSIILGQLAMQAIKSILQVIVGVKFFVPTFYFNLKEIKGHLKFGLYNVGDGLVGYVQGNADNFAVSTMLGPQALGYYTLALQLAVFPVQKLNPIILQIAYPLIAKLKDKPLELKNAYLKVLDLISFVNFPLLVGLFITASGVVPLIYGPNWEPTFPLIKIFVFVSIIGCLGHPLYTLVYTKDKPQLLFKLNLFILIVKVPLVYIMGKLWQETGIALSYLIATVIHTTINLLMVNFILGNFFKSFFRNLIQVCMFCVMMLILIYFYQHFVGNYGITNLLVQIFIGGVTYITLTLMYKYSFRDIKHSLL